MLRVKVRDQRDIWRNANLGYAKQLMTLKKYRKALEYIDQARKWPVSWVLVNHKS